ncbi:MAG: C45 family autoproteolytic acyltransferase/hydrolase, partial [Rubrobacter sp.]
EMHWPSYRRWFLSEGYLARPGYVSSVKKLRQYMPELVPVYEELVGLAGGGDLAARFLSLYRPPPYLLGCSQAVWSGPNPVLVRNYDYSPWLFEGTLLFTSWHRPVIAMIDCLWGVLDGINEAGLAVSLAFGGRRIVGDGFGIPLILRYILEFCESAEEASEVLRQVPVHMPYNVTLVDRAGAPLTAHVCPGRATVVTDFPVATNHQQRVEAEDYARMTSTVERQRFLASRLADADETRSGFTRRFLRSPLHNTRYEQAFGTLYTAAYYPHDLAAEYHWPRRATLRQSFSSFEEKDTMIHLKPLRASFKTRTVS